MKSFLKKFRALWHKDILYSEAVSTNSLLVYQRSIFSYIQNEVALKNAGGGGVKKDEFSYHEVLHRLLHVRRIAGNLKYERLGKENDGGYIVVSDKDGNVSSSKIAYSFGIADDVSFDLDLAKRGYEVFQYDHTIKNLPQENKNFHWQKLGLAAESDSSQRLETLENMLKANGHENLSGLFLKMDIEGYEWEVFNSLSQSCLEKFDQIVLELHDLINYDKKIIKTHLTALENLSKTHQAVHVHANNYCCVNYCGNLVTPEVLEVTFVLRDKYKFSDEKVENVRLEIDRSNSGREDIELGSWNL